jgi:hypothetical protein
MLLVCSSVAGPTRRMNGRLTNFFFNILLALHQSIYSSFEYRAKYIFELCDNVCVCLLVHLGAVIIKHTSPNEMIVERGWLAWVTSQITQTHLRVERVMNSYRPQPSAVHRHSFTPPAHPTDQPPGQLTSHITRRGVVCVCLCACVHRHRF